MSDAPRTIRHVVIRGRVQRVGYRAWTERMAVERGLEGWVRNRREGAVEAVFAGPAALVADMIGACRRGPRNAQIDTVEQRDGTLDDLDRRHAGESFSVLPTE